MIFSLRKICRDKSGAALVELSLMLPILVVLMAFITDFSRAIYQYHVAEKGVKSAARYLARVPNVTVCAVASFDDFRTNAVNVAQRGSFDASEGFKLASWKTDSDITISVDCKPNAIDEDTGQSPFYGPAEIPVITVSTTFALTDANLLNMIKVFNPSHENRSGIQIIASHDEVYVGD